MHLRAFPPTLASTMKPAWRQRFSQFHQTVFCRSQDSVNPRATFCIRHRPRQSRMTSIFFLTSIFNPSIHSSIAVFYLGPHIHEKWKGRIETWQPRKRQRRRPRRNNGPSQETKRGRASVPFSFVTISSAASLHTAEGHSRFYDLLRSSGTRLSAPWPRHDY